MVAAMKTLSYNILNVFVWIVIIVSVIKVGT